MKSFFTKKANVSDFTPSLHQKPIPSLSTKWIFPLGLMMAITLFSAGNAWGQTVIAGWDFSPLTGGSGNYGPSPLAATTEDVNVSIGGLTRADGIGTSGTGSANAWGGNDFEEGTDLASGISNNNFVTFTITVDAGWALDLEEIQAYNIRRSATGPTTGQWQYQVGNGSYVNLGSAITWGTVTSAAGNPQGAIDLSGESALQNIPAGTVITFRIVSWSASSAGGTWYINDPEDDPDDDLVVMGTVSECTTPPSAGAPFTATTCAGVGVNINGNPSGGVAPYTHLWTDLGTGTATGVSLVNENSQTVTASASGLGGGTIDLEYKVTDSEGCIGTKTVTVTVNPSPTGSIAADINPICFGTTVTFTAIPGMLTNYDFKVNGMSEQSSASNTYSNALLEDGWDVSVEATDANGCIADFGTVSMLVYDLPVPAIGAQTDVSCYGASDGSVTITGGDEYKLGANPYQMSGTFSGLTAGPYTITVRDANQCTATILVTITEPAILSATVASTQPTCFGTDDGIITISSPMGGSNAFDYSIDGGTSWTAGLNNNGLAPGTYNVRIRDENEITCVVDLGNQILAYPTVLSATVTATQPTCFGTNDGIITISSSAGGSGLYDYSIDGGVTWTASLSNIALAPGTYNVRIRDEDYPGCVIDLGNQVLAYPAVLSATAAATDVTCFGGSDGTITISNQSGGSGSYQYSISGGFSYQNTPSYTNLAPGSYNVRMRDMVHQGCFIIINGSLNISEPAILSADVSATQPTCFGTNDGTITISSPAGGSGDFEYSIDGGTSWTAGLNNTNLAPGTYNVQIRDENHPACVIDLGNQVLAYPAILSAMVAATQPTCFGTNDGTITISSPMGGSNAFDYSIDGGTNWTAGLNNTGLAPGTYNVRIRDENHPGCVVDLGNQMLAYPTILSATVTPTQPTCFGTNDGIITISSPAGGSGLYDYSIDGGATWTASLSNINLAPGTYNVQIRDENHTGCVIDLGNQVLAYPAVLSATAAATDVTCFGDNDGTITISNQSGGSGSYQYSISGGFSYQNTPSYTNLAPGSYNVRMRDMVHQGCFIILDASLDITEPAILSATVNKTNVTCFNANDGTITVSSPMGGYGTYEYRLDMSSWQMSGSFSGLAPGVYSVQIRDAAQISCVITLGNQTITEPNILSATVNKTDVTCFGANDGTITVSSPLGGYGTYEYRLDMGSWQMSGSFSGLAPGVYSVQIRDAAQIACVITLGNQTITEPNILSATVNKTDVTCFGANDGTITVSSPLGGYGTYEYRLDMGSWQMSGIFTGLAPGVYSVQIRDAAQIACVTTLGNQTITEPDMLSATVDKTDVTCFGANDGTITVSSPMGGYGTYEYRLDMGSWQMSGIFTGLAPGVYSVQIRDAAQIACVNTLGNQTITEPDMLSATVDKTDVTCFGANDGTITVSSPMGGYGTYEYRLDMGSWQMSGSFTGLAPGVYSVQIRDAAQIACVITLGNQTITEPNILSATVNKTDVTCFGANDGTITISAPMGGYGTYEYRLDMGSWQGSGSFTGLLPGTYSVQIRDAAQIACEITLGNQMITQPDVLSATVNKTNLTCFGADDGTITVSDPLGGYGTYEYRLDMGSWQMGGSFTSLTPGTYSVQIRDAAHPACVIDLGDQTITEPAQVPVAPITGSNYLYVGGTSQLANATPMGVWGTSNAGVASVSAGGLVTGNAMGTAIISYTVTDNMNCTNSATMNITVDEPIIDIGLFNFNSPTPAGYNKLKVKIRPIIDVNNANYTSGIFTIRCKSSDNVQFTNADIVSASFGYYLETTALNVDDNGIDYNYFTFFFEDDQQYVTWAEDVEVDVLTLRYPCGVASFEIVTDDAWTSANNADYYQELAGAAAERIIYQPTAASPTALSLSKTHVNILCGEVNTGSINLSVLTGVTPYAYIWSNGATTEDIMDLAAGTYTVTVTDGNGCTVTSVTTIQYLPVTNLTDMPNTYYPSIQAAINAAANNDEIEVCAGTYNENLTVSKPINLLGANMDEIGCSGRGPESIIAGTGGTAVTIASDEVAINGFTITNPTGSFGIYAKGRNSTTIRYNIITDIGNNVSGTGSTYGVSIEMGSTANISNVQIDNNCVHNLRGGQNTALMGLDAKNNNGSAIGIGAGFSTAEYNVTDLRIESNFIYDITASTADWLEGGKGAYGVLINVGAGAGVGKAVNPGVQSNDIHELEGLWAHGIGLEGETENAAVLYNEVYNLIDHKTPSDAEGVRIEDNVDNNIQINQNSFTNIGVGYAGLAINNTETNPVLASCNWYGSTASGVIATRISGNVNYPDWDVIGAVPDPLVAGYVSPPMSCLGSKVVISSVVPDQIICGETTGSLTVTFENDPGPDAVPYNVAWNGPGSPAIGVTSPYTITGLPAGNYTITVTDTYFSTATAMGTVQYLPVANTSDIPVSYYATIQAAIDAATTENGETLEVCAGTYFENITVDKSLILKGAQFGVDGCISRTGESIIMPALGSTATTAGTGSTLVTITAPNVTMDGFTFDGDNTSITNPFTANGANPDVDYGIFTEETGLTVQNNIIKNIFQFGVAAGRTGNTAGQGTIVRNIIDNIPYWAGILLYDDYYALVEENCFNNTWVAVQVDNFYQAAPGVSSINDNVISTGTIAIAGDATYEDVHGIRINNVYQNASTWNVASNAIINTTVGSKIGSTGLELWNVQGTVAVTVSDNVVDNFDSGYFLWSGSTSSTVTISGTANDCNTGVLATNKLSNYGSNNSSYVLTDLTITDCVTGIKVLDDPTALPSQQTDVTVNITTGVTIENGTTGILIENTRASLPSAGSVVMTGQTGDYIKLVNSPNDVLATSASFDGETGATASLAENFLIEDKIVHKIDEGALGFVLVKAGEDFVTPLSFTANTLIPSIQRGVDAASNGFIVNVAAGTYTDNVVVNKSLTILGPKSGVDGCDPGRGIGEAIVKPGVGTATSDYSGAGTKLISVTADNVTIDGLTLDGDNTLLTGPFDANGANFDVDYGISTVGATAGNNLIVQNNIIRNTYVFGVLLGATGTPKAGQVKFNKIDNVPYFAGVIASDNYYASIRENCISDVWMGVQADNFYVAKPMGATAEIVDNTISTQTQVITGDPLAPYTDVHGIRANLIYQSASTWLIDNNNVTNTTVGGTGSSGIQIWSVLDAAALTITNNSSTGFESGYLLWNAPTTSFINIVGGTVSNSTHGVKATNVDTYGDATSSNYVIDGVDIQNSSVNGILVDDDVANGNNATVTVEIKNSTINGAGSANGVRVSGADATANINNNTSGISGTALGVDVDGGTATIYRNTITANGTGVRAINGGNLTSVTENFITNHTTEGIRIEANAGTIGLINYNDLSGNTGFAINNLLAAPQVDATCNWYGSAASGFISGEVNGNVDYAPWLTSGTDNEMGTNGFQSIACNGTLVVIVSAVPDHIICGEASNSGTIEVTFSGGSPTYTVDWGGTPATMLVGSPYTITGLMAGTYNVTVTDTYGSTTSTMVEVEYLPVTNVSDMPNTYYPSIQAAIDAVTTVNGETIEVCEGIYTENIVVNKSLTILGPQANVDADTRFAAFTGGPANPKADPLLEAILTPATNNPTGGNPGANDQIRVLISGVTINGFVIDGNNPDIAGVSGTQINGVDIDGRRALTNVDNANNVVAINNLNVRHNILQNFGQRAVSLSGAGSLTGNVITENVIRNFLEQGVLLLTNAYVDVTNNTIEVPGSAIGLHLQNFHLNGSMSWTGNNVTVGQDAFGIHANLFYAPLGTLNINSNTVNAATGVTGASDDTWGINVWSVSTGANVALNSNIVGSAGGEFGRGINLWNLPTSNTVSITGGTVGNSVIGINLDNIDPYYGAGNNTTVNVSGTIVTGGTIGIRARTEVLPVAPLFAPNIVDGNTTLNLTDVVVDGAATGIQIKAPAASAPFTATGVVDEDSEVKNGSTAGVAIIGAQAEGTLENNDAAISITGNLIGVEVDGGTATVYRNRIHANGTGIRAINGGNLTSATENFITNNTSEGVRIEADAGTIGGINFNDISGNTTYSIHNLLATPAVDATCNWYGTNDPNVFDAFIIGGVDYAPYLNAGLDNEALTPGFQPAPMTCVELTDFYVNDDFTVGDLITTAVGLDGPGTRGTANRPYRHINTAINAAANGNTIRVDVGTYSDEQVLVDKDLTILGTTGSPAAKPIINFTGTPDPMEPLALFRVTYPGVTIHNFEFQPDVSKLGSAIVASNAVNGVSDLTILNNTVNPYRSSGVTVAYSLLNAFNINYGSHRVNSSNPVNLLVQGNTVAYNIGADMMPGTADDAGFRAGVAVDEGTGTFTANTLQTINQDIEVRFTNTANDVNITNNFINGGGVNFAAPNNGGGNLNITGNTFDGAASNSYTSSLRVKDNIDAAAMTTLIENNTFINHNWGISLENYKAVTVNNNTFTPASMSTTFRHITVNTKELNTSSATVMQTDIDGTFTSNKFYGSGIAGGKGMVFLNHDSDDDGYGIFTVGGAGALANEFSSQIAVFMEMDQSSGPSWPSAFPENNLGVGAITTMACWAEDINIEQNTFDVGAGQQLPINMTGPQRATLETKLYHEPDSSCLGLFIYFKPIEVTAKVYLQGPYDTGTNKMNDKLRLLTDPMLYPVFPLSTPYDTMPDFVKVNNYVMETIATGVRDNNDPDNAIVDWVWVELRAANGVTVVATRSALVQRDGDIVDMDGTSEVQFPDTYEGNYFLMIRHRNHLGAMTDAMVAYIGGSPFVDFSDPALVTKGATPTSARKLLETGVYGLWAGNVNQKDNNNNWRILYNGSQNDRNEILKRVGPGTPLNIVQGYYHEDVNMNGETKYSGSGNDRVIILNNLGASNPLGNITQEPNN